MNKKYTIPILYFLELLKKNRVSNEKLKELGISKSTALRIRKELIENGIITEDGKLSSEKIKTDDIISIVNAYALRPETWTKIRFEMLGYITMRDVEPVAEKVVSTMKEIYELKEKEDMLLDQVQRLEEKKNRIIDEISELAAEMRKLNEKENELKEGISKVLGNAEELEKAYSDMAKLFKDIKKTRFGEVNDPSLLSD